MVKFGFSGTYKPSQINEQQVDVQNYQVPKRTPDEIANMPDPFENASFDSEHLPDIPVADQGAAMLNALLSDDTVPDEIKEEFWFVFHRDNVLTFLDADRKKSKLLGFDILKIDSLHSTPYYEYTFDKEKKWNSARQILEVKLDRALGNKSGKNERLTIPMTIQENITRTVPESQGEIRTSFLKRMLNRR